jgi:hypothetical protein
MSENEMIMEKLSLVLQKLEKIEQQSNPATDTSMVDLPTMAQELGYSESHFRNVLMPRLMKMGIIRKYGGRYKAFRRDFEMYKLNP